ncbi:MAG: hypothetical protein KDA84_25310 [Planctomycetaceae bacterium]|nr:hypothetical protein [Planctomycetaceae bacterium]
MKCDDCGAKIPRGKEIQTTRNRQTGFAAGGLDLPTSEPYQATICPACDRGRIRWSYAIGLLALLCVLGAAIAILSR